VSPDAVRRRRRRRLALLVVFLAAGGVIFRSRIPAVPRGPVAVDNGATTRPARVVPDTVRIKIEVVNATATRGLARLATAWLRDQGFDVVNTTTAAERDRMDTSLVLDRSGHPAWAALAATAMGGARVEARPDSLRFLDLTVLVGRSWRPPPQTLYP
jgi:hypothetical protein